jgi:hypothetical protein
MHFDIGWSFYIRATTNGSAVAVLERLRGLMHGNLDVHKCARYWKDEALFEVTATSRIDSDTFERAAIDALRLLGAAGDRIVVAPPQVDQPSPSLSGAILQQHLKLADIETLSFVLSPSEPDRKG